MNKFAKMMGDRTARFDRLNTAMKEFEQVTKSESGEYAYSYLAGFYMQQLIMLAADNRESTEDLVKTLESVVAKKQQSPISA
jgi:hypothetical protein